MKLIKKDNTRLGRALLKMLAMSSRSKQQGKSKPIKMAFADIRKSMAEFK